MPRICKGYAINKASLDATGDQVIPDVLADLGTLVDNGVATRHSPQLAFIWLRVRALGFRPDRPSLKDAGRVAGCAAEIGKCVGVVVGQTAGWVGGER